MDLASARPIISALSTLGYRHSLSSGGPHSGPSPSSHSGHILGPAFHGSLVQCRDPPEIPSAETPCTPCSIPGRESCSWHSSPPGICALLLHTVSLVFLILQLSLICVLGTLSLVSSTEGCCPHFQPSSQAACPIQPSQTAVNGSHPVRPQSTRAVGRPTTEHSQGRFTRHSLHPNQSSSLEKQNQGDSCGC